MLKRIKIIKAFSYACSVFGNYVLEGRYLYDSSLNDSQAFLFNHVNSKISLVILYADLVGSTNMSMTLPVTIIGAFTYEMSSIVRNYSGYVLKYVGDAIIAFFPSGHNKLLACDNAVQCANSMKMVSIPY